MKRFKKTILYILLIGIFYSFGVISMRFNIEPIPLLRKLKNEVVAKDNSEFYQSVIKSEIARFNYLLNKINPNIERSKLLNELILPNSLVQINKKNIDLGDCYVNPIEFETTFYGIKQRGILEASGNEKLLIYFQGHVGSPCDYDYYKKIKSNLSEEYDVLSFSMFGIGFNSMDSISFPAKINKTTETIPYQYFNNNYSKTSRRRSRHNVIQYYYDENYPNLKPLSIFLSSSYHIINEVINDYEEVVVTGISGGGWYSTILSGLVPKINKLYSFNGTLPLVYRISTNSTGDFEQQFSDIWSSYDYYTFYILSLYDSEGSLNRKSYHIYSELDECCFSKPEIYFFQETVRSLNISNLRTKIFKNKSEHNIDYEWLIKEIQSN